MGTAASVDRCFLIVGAPRSGTSALAWALRDQGVKMFIGATAPDQDSPTGNQEDNLALVLNRRLMRRDRRGERHDWDSPAYCAGGSSRDVRLIRAYLRLRRRDADGAWGLKDPRLCFVIEPWHEATRELAVSWIHIYRADRAAVVRSLIAMLPPRLRHGGDPETLRRLASNWAESYELAAALGFERSGVRPFRLSYEELLTPSGRRRLTSHFGLDKPIVHVDPRFNRRG